MFTFKETVSVTSQYHWYVIDTLELTLTVEIVLSLKKISRI